MKSTGRSRGACTPASIPCRRQCCDAHPDAHEELLKLGEQQQRPRRAPATVGRNGKMRIKEARQDRDTGDVDGNGRGDFFARPAVRLRQQCQEWSDASEERKHGVPA